jgi:hypothetical protein
MPLDGFVERAKQKLTDLQTGAEGVIDSFTKMNFTGLFDRFPRLQVEQDKAVLWTGKEFVSQLALSASYGTGIRVPPHEISLGTLHERFLRLSEATRKDGFERAQNFFTCFTNKSVEVVPGFIFTGTEKDEVLSDDRRPVGHAGKVLRQAINVHSHPLAAEGLPITNVFSHHFSDTDFIAFLSHRLPPAAAMIAGDKVILALKTTETPMDIPHAQLIREIEELHLGLTSIDHLTVGATTTKATCKRYNLALYVSDEKRPHKLYRVDVDGGIDQLYIDPPWTR